MIQYSYRQSQNYTFPPEFYTLNNIKYWRWSSITSPVVLNPNVGSGFGGSGQSWALSSSFLSNIGFSYTNSWCFIIRGIRNIHPEYFTQIIFDTHSSTWTPNSGSGQDGGPLYITFLRTNVNPNGNNTILTTYNNDSFFDSEFYMIFSYDIATKNIKIEIMDLLGNMKSAIRFNNYTYTNKINPFHMYNNKDTFTFNRGVVYNTFSPYFT